MNNKEQRKAAGDDNRQERKDGGQKSSADNAARLDAIISSPTDAARSHRHTDTLGNQGTSTSYEGPTAPGGGGSVGTGYSSGQDAVGAKMSTSDAADHVTGRSGASKTKGEELMKPDRQDDDLDRDTLGTP